MARFLTIQQGVSEIAKQGRLTAIGQCLNFSTARSRELEVLLSEKFPYLDFKSEIAIGNVRMGDDRDFIYDDPLAQMFAQNPLRAFNGRSEYHAWNVIDGVIIDLTLFTSLRSQGAPIESPFAFSDTLVTRQFNFLLEWVPHATRPASELRKIMGLE